jgi:putative redox protein
VDVETLMGKARENRAGFSGMQVIVKMDADMSEEERGEFLHEIDLRCPVSDNIKNLTPISFEVA